MQPKQSYDLAVVGAGPAGLSAATTAAKAGLTVVLIDSAAQTGGQFWRHPNEAELEHFDEAESTGHHHWRQYRSLRATLFQQIKAGLIDYWPNRQVWTISAQQAAPGFLLRSTATLRLHATQSQPDDQQIVSARRLVLATGAADRQLPVPGWDLPGVMAAGGVQAMVKANQIAPGTRAVVAGTGPFLLPVAAGLAEIGVKVLAVCEANSPTRWLPHLAAALPQGGKAVEAVQYATAFARHRIPYKLRTIVREVHGTDQVSGVTLSGIEQRGRVTSKSRRLDVDLVALGWGFTPALELIIGLGAKTKVDLDGSLVAVVDSWQRSSVPGLYIAGEATGVGGSVQALKEGELAGRSAVRETAAVSQTEPQDRRLARAVGRSGRFAAALHQAYPVPEQWSSWLTAETIVCRCEETSFAELSESMAWQGESTPRLTKLTSRAGMGWCQGRICGFATSQLSAQGKGCQASTEQLAPIQKRPIAAPLSLAELAQLDVTETPQESEGRHV
ncbi:FAD-dependent oxidoreductase [Psychromicrobium lacuslunae]|uniref:Oxidoreductase n=1 Tax=Psychromicrobium lacuslunae TaxID=1618207 RepID=A0A0D4C0T2_9MICC|nr:FAD-dependent oxidoreductase [Psychromicrobium lacuslunae]AJT42292.1 oxidoreductase [Psychromicrobium lacuslunae]